MLHTNHQATVQQKKKLRGYRTEGGYQARWPRVVFHLKTLNKTGNSSFSYSLFLLSVVSEYKAQNQIKGWRKRFILCFDDAFLFSQRDASQRNLLYTLLSQMNSPLNLVILHSLPLSPIPFLSSSELLCSETHPSSLCECLMMHANANKPTDISERWS